MDLYLVSVLIFMGILAVLVYKDRKKFKRESILLLRRTQRGKGIIIWLGTRFPRGWKWVGYLSVAFGFIVSILGTKMLFDNFVRAFTARVSAPSLALLLPSPTSQPVFGYGFLAVPFWYWIICIALLALVHEGLHGIFAAREGVRIKSMGVGLLAVIPLAFVEPDEKQLEKKGMWPMLRVFSAGSFSNFLLAGVTLLVIIAMAASIFYPAGVSFGLMMQPPYPAAQIEMTAIQKIGNVTVNGAGAVFGAARIYDDNDTIEITAGNRSYFLKKSLLVAQLNQSNESIVAFLDFPAAKAGLEGTIIRVDGYIINDALDLSVALEEIGPGKTVEITTRAGEVESVYTLTTVQRPENPPYEPDAFIGYLAGFEHIIPGSVEFFYSAVEVWAGLLGQRTGVTWAYANEKIGIWQWVHDYHPLLRDRAEMYINYWGTHVDSHPRPGFIGILGIVSDFRLKPALEPYKESLDFIQGLLFFVFLINVGVGMVNLLPLKPLDGGRMWDAVLRKYLPKKYAVTVVRVLGYLTLLLLLLNFVPFGALF